ncbi:uncharacterized protein EV420DRAFT_1492024 [Desarmillaria tabescens]|uniref:Uncharacterized protein n=1 Tax=Armillaria tabescens TaxID=1929756 RepID=A0AA39MJF4_ARMTA|nr:uncharacterized protein EV420DRAFT_1589103 [Desarmillaria tabescens]XP_060327110.1 uncharacterized protein EV420DRAFT_1564271 [Desarmillaria tabescens]XP_060334233.1 uncharacterized protein EV420DRAFT_1525948 [Desarmillaria tabescens]XP_060337050.1 uncharacterized protein EV420DRAFT_1510629 [Desarmillaria tabescens]XP_060338819.1 uncharacterized protein EV420DRAFT_1492024 [Desarmillaria tabescens]KAK0437101.1 hypothetical protein EV420DRAFT_1589103 [Desarmillaria tabescens]KAK0449818.1 hyp
MPGHAKSNLKKCQITCKCHDQLMEKAVIAHKNELAKLPSAPQKDARKICKDFEAVYQRETGKEISLSYSTRVIPSC